jgi:HEPN domain-containing protein
MQVQQSQESQNQDIRELLTKISQNVEHLQEELTQSRQELQEELIQSRQELQAELIQSRQELQEEVKRWDTRFFDFSRDSLNRANTLIASATISVIAGVILLLLRQ